MIEIYLLQQLKAFAEAGTLSGASEILHISQPALSNSMKKLEEIIGVKLFDRSSNRITLNENGRLAVTLAEDILNREKEMEERIRRFDRNNKTVALASCAPMPLWELVPVLTETYEGMTISSELLQDNDAILNGVTDGVYKIGVIHGNEPVLDYLTDFEYAVCGSEKLFLVVPHDHPLAVKEKVTGTDIDGQNLLLHSKIGFWYTLVREKLPNAHFLMMDDFDVFCSIAETEAFPSFATDASLKDQRPAPKNKKILPIDENYAVTSYIAVWKKEDGEFLKPFIKRIKPIEKTK